MGVFLKQNIINKVVEFNNVHKQLDAEQLNKVANELGHIAETMPEQNLIVNGTACTTPIVQIATKRSESKFDTVDGVEYEVLSEDTIELIILNNVLTWVTRSCDCYFNPETDDVEFVKNDVIQTVDIHDITGYKFYGTN